MSGIVQGLLASFSSAAAVVTDAYFYLVTLLLNTTTTNGAQNNTFLDSSSSAFTITRNGNTTQGTFTPFSQTGWSNYFSTAVTSFLTVTGSAATNLNGGDWTVETWFYKTALSGGNDSIIQSTTGTNAWIPYFAITTNDALTISASINAASYTSTQTYALNTWNHIAVVRSGGVVKVYLNGSATSISVTTDVPNSNLSYWIGKVDNSPGGGGYLYYFNGYLSNLRITKGGALYTSNFTPSTVPLTTTVSAGTVSMLTCQSNRFVDSSATPLTIVVGGGSPSVQAFSPFAPTAAYSTTTVGGSGYFDGTGDYLSVADAVALQFGSGTFTINCWIYRAVAGAIHTIAAKGAATPTGWVFQVNASNQLVFTDTSTSITSTTTIPFGTWAYVSVVRSGTGTNQTVIYINAVSSGTGTSATNFNQTTALNIGADRSNANTFNGYIAGFEYVKGSALSIAIPTLPPTTSNSPSLLLNATNAGIYDAAAKNDLETVGNAQVSTTQAKFGTTSMAFDGTGDYLVEPTNVNYGYGTGDFTIEFWVYFNTVSSDQTVVSNLSSVSSVNPHIYLAGTSSTLRYFTNNADRITSSALSSGQWYYVAVVRAAGSTKMYINGTQAGSTYTDANNYGASAPLGIGTYWSAGSPVTTATLNGYLDEVRITRYARTITTPTAAFPVQ